MLSVATHVTRGDDSEALVAARAVEQQFVDVIARCEGAVVSFERVDVDGREERQPFLLQPRGRAIDQSIDLTSAPRTFGSGVIIASESGGDDRFILTNDHILRASREATSVDLREPIHVRLSSHRSVRAVVVASDPRSDLAILRVNLQGTGIDPAEVTPIPLGDATKVRKGQMVLALGNPYAIARDGSASASWGIISNISRAAPPAEGEERGTGNVGTIHEYGTLLHVDSRLDLGMSGGALVNLKGELIGLTTSLAALEGYEKSVGFAIPIDASIRRVIESLLQGFEVEYGFLGIHTGDVVPGEARLPDGRVSAARAMFVSAGSPAARGGMRDQDVILAINGQPVFAANDLMREIGLLGPGMSARLDVWRPSERRKTRADVTLGKWPVIDDSQIIATQQRYPQWRGLRVDYPTARRRFLTSDVMERYHHAVLILSVADDSPAHAAGLRPGDFVTDVGDVTVEEPGGFYEAVSRLSGPVTLTRLDGTRIELPRPEDN